VSFFRGFKTLTLNDELEGKVSFPLHIFFLEGLGASLNVHRASKKRGQHIQLGVGGILGNHIFEDGVLDNWSEDIRPGRCLSCQVICEFDCGWIA